MFIQRSPVGYICVCVCVCVCLILCDLETSTTKRRRTDLDWCATDEESGVLFVHKVHFVLYALMKVHNYLNPWNKYLDEKLTVAPLFKTS